MKYNKRQDHMGFTLIEMLVVVSIMAILGGVAIMAYIGYQERSRQASIRASVSNAASELQGWIDKILDGEPVDATGSGKAVDFIPLASLDGGLVPGIYVALRNGAPFNDTSPWNAAVSLWVDGATVDGAGQIFINGARIITIRGTSTNAAEGVIAAVTVVAD